jgi:hypothetical protein
MKTLKKTKLFRIIICASLTANLSSCKKPTSANEEELITTIQVNLTDSATNQVSTFVFTDPDGDGGNNPIQFDTIKLKANTTYNCSLSILDESKTPVGNITDEIIAEGTDHQFYYTPSAGLNVSVGNLNTDNNGLLLGTTGKWITSGNSNGRVQITLKHKPGIKAADDAITVGDTDIELPNDGFYTIIQ